MVKRIFILMSCFIAVSLCSTSVCAESIIKAAKDNVDSEVIEYCENMPAVISDVGKAEVKAVYTDKETIRAVLIKSSRAVESLKTGESVYACPEPDSQGFIYVSTNEKYNGGSVDIVVDGVTSTVAPTDIVTTREKWQISDDGHTLVKYMGSSENIVVPNFYDGEIITALGNGKDISDKDKVKTVIISEGIIKIGNYAFYEMSGLTAATLPESIEVIGGAAFADSSLSGELTIPQNTKIIYAYAFTNTDITSVKFNKKLERLCSYAFACCGNMGGEIELPSSLNYLGDWAFEECSKLTGGITIPGSVSAVGEGAFFNCPLMTGKIVLEEGVEEIGLGAFGADSAARSGFTAVEFPSTLKKIGPYAFQLADNITYIELPEGLETISDGAFDHMTGLTNEKLVIPSTVSTIGGDYNVDENTGYGGHVFYDMGKDETFKSIEVAEGNEYFTSVEGVLYNKAMTRLAGYPRGKSDEVYEIPEGITQMDELCFSRAAYLKKIILPDSYVISQEIPPNVLNHDANSLSAAIYVYTAVSAVDVKPTNEKYVSENGILYSKDKKSLWYIPNQYEGNITVSAPTQKLEKGCVFIASRSNTKWGNIYLPRDIIADSNTAEYIYTFMRGFVYGEDNSGVFLYGDINGDGRSDRADIFVLLKKISVMRGANTAADDYNMDKKVDIRDVIALMRAA